MSLSQIYSPPPILLTHCMALRLLHFILFYYLWAIFCPFWIICVKAIVVKSSESITRLLLLLLLSCFSCVWLCATPWRQPIRLHRPWDFPGKNTGVGCHFLLQCMKVKSKSEVAQSLQLLATPWTAACQAPLSMGFSRQEYWSGVPWPSLHICHKHFINIVSPNVQR